MEAKIVTLAFVCSFVFLCLVGWSVGWLVGCLVVCLFVCLFVHLFGWCCFKLSKISFLVKSTVHMLDQRQ